jgi:hypothetical protein
MEVAAVRKESDKKRTSIEMKFFGRVAGYTLFDGKRKEE